MNLSGFDKAKEVADDIQENTKGEKITNPLGTNNVNAPIDDDIAQFNKGVEVMSNIGNYHVLSESTMGSFRPTPSEEEIETPPFIAPEVEKGREERMATTQSEEAEEKRIMEKSTQIGVEPMQYKHILFLKENSPEKIPEYLRKELPHLKPEDVENF